jgi:hypothetical protein
MNRRGFLSAIVGAVLAPFVPAPVRVPTRHIYARIRITREMLAGERGAWNRAADAEWAGVIRDMRDTRNLAFLRGRQWVR